MRLFQNFSFWNSFLPRRKLHESQMLALQEIGNFLQELVSKPTGFWNKLIWLVIINFTLASCFESQKKTIRDTIEGTLTRYGLNPSDPVYEYKTQKFDYNILGDEEPPESVETEKTFGEFNLWYGIRTSPNSALIIQENGEMIVRYGPPFSFLIHFTRMDNNLETIHFNSLELTGSNNHNLLELDDIFIRAECSGTPYAVMKEYGYNNTIQGRDLFDEFKKDKNVHIGPLARNVKQNAMDDLKNNEFFSESERNKLMNGGYYISSITGFRNIAIDFLEDEEITIKIDFDLIMTDGENKNFKFANTYKRQYEEGSMVNRFAPSAFDNQHTPP
jgi:hypothetical protein